ncbi:MAG: hypothetical protein LQ342_004584 [Letrouitia transgressa]|nr:MAG: hypothetical protein LQ342_004584 [Letrouitia transgressa]
MHPISRILYVLTYFRLLLALSSTPDHLEQVGSTQINESIFPSPPLPNITLSRGYYPINVPIPGTFTSVQLRLSLGRPLSPHDINELLSIAAERISAAKTSYGRYSRIPSGHISYGPNWGLGVAIFIAAERRRVLTWQQVGDTIRALRIYEYVNGLRSQVDFIVCERGAQFGHGVMRASYGNFLESDSASALEASKRAIDSGDQALELSPSANSSDLERPYHYIKVDVEGTSLVLWLAEGVSPLDPSHVTTFLEHTTAFIRTKIETYGPQRQIGGVRSTFDYNMGTGLRMHVEALPLNYYNWRMMDSLVMALRQYHRAHAIDHELTFDVRRGPRPFGNGFIDRVSENLRTIPTDVTEASKRDVTLDGSDFSLNDTDNSLGIADATLNDTLISEFNLTRPNYSIKIPVDGTFLMMSLAPLPNQPLNTWEVTQLFLRMSIHIDAQMRRSGPHTNIPGPRSSFDYTPYTSQKMLFHAESQPPHTFTWSDIFFICKSLEIYHRSHHFNHAFLLEVTKDGRDFGSGYLRPVPPDITIAKTMSANAGSPTPNEWIQVVVRGQFDIFFLPGTDALPRKYLTKLIQRARFTTEIRMRNQGAGHEIASPWHTASSEGFVLELFQSGNRRMTLLLVSCVITGLEQVVFSEGHWVTMHFRVQDFDQARSAGALLALGQLRIQGAEQKVESNLTVDSARPAFNSS